MWSISTSSALHLGVCVWCVAACRVCGMCDVCVCVPVALCRCVVCVYVCIYVCIYIAMSIMYMQVFCLWK